MWDYPRLDIGRIALFPAGKIQDGEMRLDLWNAEVTGRIITDMKKMAADPETQRWWKETDPCQLPLPEAAAQGKIWSDCTEVYHLP
jgi:L-rhamnose mutarotase